MDRFVESRELLGGVFFLCDDKTASAITGVVLPFDAGLAAYSGVLRRNFAPLCYVVAKRCEAPL